jgi:hypothetical protein
MDEKTLQEIFHELISSLEAMDTQSSAISQFLKDKGIATPEQLAPYLERAGNASGVRWLGTRVRVDYLFSTAGKGDSGEVTESSLENTQAAHEPAEKSHERPEQGADRVRANSDRSRGENAEEPGPQRPHNGEAAENKSAKEKRSRRLPTRQY